MQSVTANGLTIEMPEPHRGNREPLETNSAILKKRKFDPAGRLTETTTSGGTDPAGALQVFP